MVCGADVLCDIQLLAKFHGEVQCEVCVSIGDDLGRHSEMWENMLHIECHYPLASDGLLAWEKQ
jgi:hypothetical protein